MAPFKITAVDPNVRDWESKMGGPMKSYKVRFAGEEGLAVEWSRKATSPAPQVGQTVEGTIEDGQYGKKFKATPTSGGGFGGGRPRDPAERRSIEMQHAQKCAVEALRLAALAHEGYKVPRNVSELTSHIKIVASALFLQVEEASEGKIVPPREPVRRDVERTGKSDITSTEDIDALKQALKYEGPDEDIPFPTKEEAAEMAAQAREES